MSPKSTFSFFFPKTKLFANDSSGHVRSSCNNHIGKVPLRVWIKLRESKKNFASIKFNEIIWLKCLSILANRSFSNLAEINPKVRKKVVGLSFLINQCFRQILPLDKANANVTTLQDFSFQRWKTFAQNLKNVCKNSLFLRLSELRRPCRHANCTFDEAA